MRKTVTKLSKVKIGNGQRLWCVTWPKIGTGRNRQFFKDKTEAETVLQQKLIDRRTKAGLGCRSMIGNARSIWNAPRSFSHSA